MSDDDFDVEALIDAMAQFLDLPVEDAYREGIAGHLKAAHGIARDVLAVVMPDDAEPAPVFKA